MSATAQIGYSSPRRSSSSRPLFQQYFLRWSFLVLLIVGPVCFGATEPWSLFILEAGSVVVFIMWLVGERSFPINVDTAPLILGFFAVLGTVQLAFNITVYKYATEQDLLKAVLYFVSFVLGQHLLRSHEARAHCAQLLAVFGGMFALFAIVQRLHGNGRIYWLRATDSQSFFGSYANKNHYAGLMELLIPFALLNASNAREEIGKRLLFTFAASLMVSSVFLSGSRGGVISTLFEVTLFMSTTVLISSRRRPISVSSALMIACAIALIVWIGGGALIDMTQSLREPLADASLSNRANILHDSIKLIRERPIFGWGLGTFATVYPQVQSWYSDLRVNAAHNDYLQLLVEAGIAGLTTILLFLFLVFRAGLRRAFLAPRNVVLAALVACAGLLLHSFTDFNLHVPANAALFFALCGLICAVSDDSDHEERR